MKPDPIRMILDFLRENREKRYDFKSEEVLGLLNELMPILEERESQVSALVSAMEDYMNKSGWDENSEEISDRLEQLLHEETLA